MSKPISTIGKFLSKLLGEDIETNEPVSTNGKLLKEFATKLQHEQWEFTLDDGTTLTKEVLVWNTED